MQANKQRFGTNVYNTGVGQGDKQLHRRDQAGTLGVTQEFPDWAYVRPRNTYLGVQVVAEKSLCSPADRGVAPPFAETAHLLNHTDPGYR